jgi:hypothetical protein
VSKDVPHCPFLRFEVKIVACVWGDLKKTPLLLSMQWHERSDQHHNDQHWSHANNFLGRRILPSTMATRLRRRGIPLSVQSHNSWVDLRRPSFWIALQISQFMVRSLFSACFGYPLVLVFDPPLFDNLWAADLFPTSDRALNGRQWTLARRLSVLQSTRYWRREWDSNLLENVVSTT